MPQLKFTVKLNTNQRQLHLFGQFKATKLLPRGRHKCWMAMLIGNYFTMFILLSSEGLQVYAHRMNVFFCKGSFNNRRKDVHQTFPNSFSCRHQILSMSKMSLREETVFETIIIVGKRPYNCFWPQTTSFARLRAHTCKLSLLSEICSLATEWMQTV